MQVVNVVVPEEFQVLWDSKERKRVVKYPSDVLRRVAQPVPRVNKATRELIDVMEEIMEEASGIGLAAPQVGVSERVIVMAPGGTSLALINPEIIRAEGEVVGQEGCLSLPGLYGDVKRRAIVEVRALNREGKQVRFRFEGLAARVVQHEIDHLDGILFIDKVDPATLHWAWPVGRDAE